MEILVKLGKTEKSGEVKVTVPSLECSVADVLSQVRRKIPPMYAMVLQLSEGSGSSVFLAMDAEGEPERLIETKLLKDYVKSDDNCTLWLMCAPVDDDGEPE
jgi:hypothetical protein